MPIAIVGHLDLQQLAGKGFVPGTAGGVKNRVASVMVPPCGRASTALNTRLVSASRKIAGIAQESWQIDCQVSLDVNADAVPFAPGSAPSGGRVNSMTSSMT